MLVRAAAHRGSQILFAWPDVVAGLVAAAGMLAAVLLAGALDSVLGFGPLATHMSQHIVVMNAAAPLAALAILCFAPAPRVFTDRIGPLALATTAQIVLLWGWHTPQSMAAAWHRPGLMLAMHLSLFAAAVLFWYAVFSIRGRDRWQPVLALLVTGKLFCLLGALLIFAPRTLYALDLARHAGHGSGMSGLADQQLAGLLMITACPLTYVTAGVIIAARWVLGLDGAAADTPPRLEEGA